MQRRFGCPAARRWSTRMCQNSPQRVARCRSRLPLFNATKTADYNSPLAGEFRFRLLVVGADLKLEGVETECHPWSEKQEKKALLETDIGIMPVRDDEWSRMKGGYKLFLYMAAGLPIVATPSGINREIVRNGVNGLAADSSDKWLDALRTLCNDEALRKRMGAEGRKDAESKYSYAVCTPLLCSCING